MGLDIVGPNGEKLEPRKEPELEQKADQGKAEAGKVEEAVDKKAVDAETEHPLKVSFSRPGWMQVEVNLDAISYHQGLVDQYSGFMDRAKHQGFTLISKLAQQRAAITANLQKHQNKNGNRNFLRSLFRR